MARSKSAPHTAAFSTPRGQRLEQPYLGKHDRDDPYPDRLIVIAVQNVAATTWKRGVAKEIRIMIRPDTVLAIHCECLKQRLAVHAPVAASSQLHFLAWTQRQAGGSTQPSPKFTRNRNPNLPAGGRASLGPKHRLTPPIQRHAALGQARKTHVPVLEAARRPHVRLEELAEHRVPLPWPVVTQRGVPFRRGALCRRRLLWSGPQTSRLIHRLVLFITVSIC
jgi:hypothetical protein